MWTTDAPWPSIVQIRVFRGRLGTTDDSWASVVHI
jgi:hypothetical protein